MKVAIPQDVLTLAAGKSTRLRPLLGDLPKPLAPLAGVPVLRRNLAWLARQGVRSTWINLHHGGADIEAALGPGDALGMRLRYSREPVLLGTGGAVAALRAHWSETLLVVYGDNLLDFDLQAMVEEHRTRGAEFSMAAFDPMRQPHTGIGGGAVQMDAEGGVVAFREMRGARPEAGLWINAGVYLVEPTLWRQIPEGYSDFGTELIPAWFGQGYRLRAHALRGYCLGLDTPEAFARAERLIAGGTIQLARVQAAGGDTR